MSSSSEEDIVTSNNHNKTVDNSSTVINKIANLYAERLMSDVILVVGNVDFPSHRLILCASSDVFQCMLMNSTWTESHETRVVLKETPSSEAVFEDFLKYLYTGKIQFDYATVIPLVSLADKYNVKDLLRIGLDYMTRNVSTACKRNQAVSWYQFTSASGHMTVANLCKEFIKSNFLKVSNNVDFPNMEASNLLNLIQCNDLVIDDEMTLFVCVDKWLCSQKETMQKLGEENISVHIDRYVHMLIPHIRFPMMTPSQLADLLLNPLSKTHMRLVVDRIRLAMCYHKDQISESDARKDSNFDQRLFTPRLYTKEKYCASLAVEHLHNLHSYQFRSLYFSSQKFWAECEGDFQSDWVMVVYPKGVWIQKCLTVYKPSGVEVPGRVLKTVRITVSTTSEEVQKVKVGILITGYQDGFEHVRKVISRNYFFNGQEQVLNFDDVLDYDELNNMKQRSYFLSGPDKDTLKISLVIVPLTKFSSLEST